MIDSEPRKIDAIRSLCPNAYFSVKNNTEITWGDLRGDTKPTDSQIAAELERLKPIFAYKASREKQYPPVVDQLDDIYHNGIDGWKATIKAIKDKYPKA